MIMSELVSEEEGVNAIASQETSSVHSHRFHVDDELAPPGCAEELVTGYGAQGSIHRDMSGSGSHQPPPPHQELGTGVEDMGIAVAIGQPNLASLKRENFVRGKKVSSESASSGSSSDGSSSSPEGDHTAQGRYIHTWIAMFCCCVRIKMSRWQAKKKS